MWDALGPWFAAGGGSGLAGFLSWLVYKLHTDAVAAERRRADEWARAYERELARGDVRETQLGEIMKVIREKS